MSKKDTKQSQMAKAMLDDSVKEFQALGLKTKVLMGVKDAGFSTPSPIQEKAIPFILERRDVIAQAQTGTGKTAAFALPIINNLNNNGTIEALIVTPTRELAMQISDEIFKLGKYLKTRTICVYGGQSVKKQLELIERKPQIMIGTPGRLLDHLKNERLKNFCPQIVVLDESDEMLDMGFIDDIEEIFQYIPNNAQTLLFSATMPQRIKELAERILYNPVHIKITPDNITNTDISQRYYIINENERNEAMTRLIDTESPSKSIVFTRTKKEADELNNFLAHKGYKSVALHGDMDQKMRRESVNAFKDKKATIMVATDVAARGLDINDISHVFNYHIPLNIESYVHRIGRTGRAGKKGVAITLVTPLEYRDLKKIQSETKAKLELYEIPGESDDKTISDIFNAKVSDDALSLYERIKDKADAAQLILRLLSLHIKYNVKIGLTKEEVQYIHQQNDEIKDQESKRTKKSAKQNKASAISNKYSHNQEKSRKRGKNSKTLSSQERAKQQKMQSQQKYYKD